MERADGVRIVFPMFAFLIEPGPRPGALRTAGTETLFVPLWTSLGLFHKFVENFEFGGPISGLRIENRYEMTEFLGRFRNPAITQVAFDPEATSAILLNLQDIDDLVEQINKPKPK